MISMGKKYQTRDGQPVELLTTRARGERPVMGYVGGQDQVSLWTLDGVYTHSHQATHVYDLVEVKPKRVMWLNVYPNGATSAYRTRPDADSRRFDGCIACLKIEFEEGEGL